MECAMKCNSPCGTSNLIELISSVNTLIDNLSDQGEDAVSAIIDRSSADINRQLEQLEKLFAQQKQLKRAERRLKGYETSVLSKAVAETGACSRSPCSNCTASNCNADGSGRPATRRGTASRRYHSASITSSSESGSSKCCNLNSGGCLLSKGDAQNASNRRQMVVRRRLKNPEPAECMDFGYLKNGLEEGQRGESSFNCGASVKNIERSVIKLRQQVSHIKKYFEQQMECGNSDCTLSEKVKTEIREVQARVAALRETLQLALGGTSASLAGCRHRGCATEQSRDLITDLKCKYERTLLYSRFDVNWPFLHIIAPRMPSWDEAVCCGHVL